MTQGTEPLEIGPIPEQTRVTLMLADVIDLELGGDLTTGGTGIDLFHTDALTESSPACGVVPRTPT